MVTAEVAGVPALLDGFTTRATGSLEEVRAALIDYRRAVEELLAAPSDLPLDVDDVSTEVARLIEHLEELDRVPAAFATALRTLDARPLHGPAVTRTTDRTAQFETLLDRHLQLGPQVGPTDDARRVPTESQGPALDPWFWSGLAVGAPLSAIDAADRFLVVPVSGYEREGRWLEARPRWRPGTASTLNRVAGADTIARWAPTARRAGPVASVAFPTLEQIVADHGDPDVTPGQRVTRTTGAATIEGGASVGGGAVGFWAGAKGGAKAGGLGGTAVAPGVGTAIGAVGGAILGGVGGSWLGGRVRDGLGDQIDWLGDRVDDVLGTNQPAPGGGGGSGRSR